MEDKWKNQLSELIWVSILDKLVFNDFNTETMIVYVVCWSISTRKDIFDTFIKRGKEWYLRVSSEGQAI